MEIAAEQKVYRMKASLELQCRETMEIRTQGYGNKTIWQRRGLFWSSKRKKKQARKNGPPQFKIPAAVSGQISFNLK